MTGTARVSPAVRLAGSVAAGGLAMSAALHAIWLVSPWPLATWGEWSRAFGSPTFRVPAPIMITVTLLFAAAAYLVGARATLLPQIGWAWVYRVGTWVVAGVLTARAVIGFAEMSHTLVDPATPELFRGTIRLYLRVYLPIFLLLGVSSACVAAGAGRATRARGPRPG